MATARSMAASDSCTAASKSGSSDVESGDSSASASQHSRWPGKTRQQHAYSAVAGRLAKAYDRIRELELKLNERAQREGNAFAVLSPTADSRILPRLQAVAVGLDAQQRAEDDGLIVHSSSKLIDRHQHVMCGAAKHLFGVDFSTVSAKQARAAQRQARKCGADEAEGAGVGTGTKYFSLIDGDDDTAPEPAATIDFEKLEEQLSHAGEQTSQIMDLLLPECGGCLEVSEVTCQTDLGFEQHDIACCVAASAEGAIETALTWLAASTQCSIDACVLHIAERLGDVEEPCVCVCSASSLADVPFELQQFDCVAVTAAISATSEKLKALGEAVRRADEEAQRNQPSIRRAGRKETIGDKMKMETVLGDEVYDSLVHLQAWWRGWYVRSALQHARMYTSWVSVGA